MFFMSFFILLLQRTCKLITPSVKIHKSSEGACENSCQLAIHFSILKNLDFII